MKQPLFHCGRVNSVRFVQLVALARNPAAWAARIARHAKTHGWAI